MRRAMPLAALACAGLIALGGPALAAPEARSVTIQNHRFQPTEIEVPAGKAIEIHVKNLDATPEEFESTSLKVEKIVVGHGQIVVRLRPLQKGTYKFFGDYHPDTAQGTIVAQ